ncbi:MAG: hypothetical protein WAU47_10835 [Desulfobaccales bacterium]
MISKMESTESLGGLTPEADTLLRELRMNYPRRMVKKRGAMVERKHWLLVAGAVVGSVFAGVLLFLKLLELLF